VVIGHGPADDPAGEHVLHERGERLAGLGLQVGEVLCRRRTMPTGLGISGVGAVFGSRWSA
jgi:hypothetical protein